MKTSQPRTMTVAQLIEHIKADNLEQVVAFQLSGVGYVQIKTRDCEEFETLLKDSGDAPLIFSSKKEALAAIDLLVKDVRHVANLILANTETHDGINTTRKVY